METPLIADNGVALSLYLAITMQIGGRSRGKATEHGNGVEVPLPQIHPSVRQIVSTIIPATPEKQKRNPGFSAECRKTASVFVPHPNTLITARLPRAFCSRRLSKMV
jgi:hypothetical protein